MGGEFVRIAALLRRARRILLRPSLRPGSRVHSPENLRANTTLRPLRRDPDRRGGEEHDAARQALSSGSTFPMETICCWRMSLYGETCGATRTTNSDA